MSDGGYHYSPASRMGIVGQFSALDMTIASIVLIAALVLFVSASVVAAIAVSIVGVALLGRWDGRVWRTSLWRRVRWIVRPRRSTVGFAGGGWPVALEGVRIAMLDPSSRWTTGAPLAAAVGRGEATLVMRIAGQNMGLAHDQKDAYASVWGTCLSSLCREGDRSIARVSVTDVHGLAAAETPDDWFAMQPVGPLSAEYSSHSAEVRRSGSPHEVWLAVTVYEGPGRRVPATALDDVASFVSELETAGFTVDRPLSPFDLGRLISRLADPFAVQSFATENQRRIGLADRNSQGPRFALQAAKSCQLDSAFHRAFELTWPRREAKADWLFGLLDTAGPKISTFVHEPLPPSKAIRELTKARTRASSNAAVDAVRTQMSSASANKLDAMQAVHDADLTAGRGDLSSFGLFVVCAPSLEELDRRSDELRRAAQRLHGCEMRALTHRHLLAWRAALPLGLRVAKWAR